MNEDVKTITVNSDVMPFIYDMSITTLLQKLSNLTSRRFVLSINKQIIPKSQYDNYAVQHGDVIEIVEAVGGG